MQSVFKIPLRDRRGNPKAWALVDEDVYEWASKSRWCLVGSPDRQLISRLASKGGERLFLHRLILGLERGDPRQGDHIDGNIRDCRRSNLRIVSRSANAQNRRSVPGTSSRHRGVSYFKRTGKWHARVSVYGHDIYLGCFDDEDEAGAVALAFRLEHMPGAVAVPGR